MDGTGDCKLNPKTKAMEVTMHIKYILVDSF